jgi:predicted transcriptional regulator
MVPPLECDTQYVADYGSSVVDTRGVSFAMSPIDVVRVKALREKRGLTQRQLAQLAGVHQPRIAELEKGKPVTITVDVLEAIAKALGTTPARLLTRKGEK